MAWTEVTRKRWERFADAVEPTGVQPADLDRLCEFVASCHLAGEYPDRSDLFHEMEEERNFEGIVSTIVEEMVYEDGPAILNALDRVQGE
jgi:hypothetical protein